MWGDVSLSLSGSGAARKSCISAEIHIGKWISHRKHCFSLREAFNPLKFLSNLPWKCSSRAQNSEDGADLIYWDETAASQRAEGGPPG